MKVKPPRTQPWCAAAPWVAAAAVLVIAVLTALPTFAVNLGLPGEADAVDYRVPLLRWMLRHRSYPVWDWTVVDDYPMLGELLMLPLHAVRPSLARLVPWSAFLITLVVCGALYASSGPKRDRSREAMLAWAWVAALYPLAFPSTLLMTDPLGTLGVLAALLGVLRGRSLVAGLGLTLAVASKYWTWPLVLPLLAAACVAWGGRDRLRLVGVLVLGAFAGALPTMVRNIVVNGGNPFFPLFLDAFGQAHVMLAVNYDSYGRGTGFIDLLRLPFDLLISSNFQNLYDYNLGVAFYLQLGAALAAVVWRRRARRHLQRLLTTRHGRALAVFTVLHLLCWFYGAQQMRFLAPALAVTSLGLLGLARRGLPPWLLALVLFLGAYTFRVAHWGDLALARGQQHSVFASRAERAGRCVSRLPEGATLGLGRRDGSLGFLAVDFVFCAPHPAAITPLDGPPPRPEFLYDPTLQAAPPGYQAWPEDQPCMWRRKARATGDSSLDDPGGLR
ncbi:MAG: hypothetical protein ABIJ09_27215 [Pseudomonadota bacterium]